MLVRQAEPRDAGAILLIHRQAVEQGNCFVQELDEFSATLDSKLKQIERMANLPSSRLFVAELDGVVVGWLSLSGYDLKKLSHVAMLGMAVSSDSWGRGVGSALVDAALDWAKSSSLRRIALAVFESNEAAISLYKKYGFQLEGIEKNEIRIANSGFVNQWIMAITW